MHSICRFSLLVWRRSFLKKGTPRDLFLPRPGSTPGGIWPKNNNTRKGPWVLHPYQVSSKSIKRFWRRSQICEKFTSQSQKCDPTDTDEMWKMNFNYHTFWIMWHQGQDVKSHFLNNSPHAFHHKDFMLFFIRREENGVTDVNATWLALF